MAVSRHAEPLSETSRRLRGGERSPGAYRERLLERIDEVDPELRALRHEPGREERTEAAVATLPERFDDERPPLFGVPVGVKDIFHVDGLLTRANSEVPAEAITGAEATAVTRLREAGAYVLGKTVTTEFAYAAPGPTRNPHDLAYTPGGSSSGSAAGVAAGLFPLALGTQTGGSVLRPAAYCGVVGFKPTYDRILTGGVVPLAPSLDTVGLFTQDVAGAAHAASVLCDGWSGADPSTDPTLGVPDEAYLEQADEAGRKAFEGHLAALEEAGYEIRHTSLFADADSVSEDHQTLMSAEAALSHHEWFEAYGDRYREETAAFVEAGREVPTGDLARTRAGREKRREQVRRTMDEHGIDLWVAPAAPGPPPEGLDSTGSSIMNRFFTYVGLPAVSVPAGTVDGLPVGLQCVAGPGEGERLLAWAEGLREAVDES